MKERILTCIICPRGCELRVALSDSGEVLAVKGNACARGETYANTECTSPMRTVTSTVRFKDGGIAPVKTSTPVPKSKVRDVMERINAARPEGTPAIGDVVIRGVAETDSDVVITGKK
jgi:CxxC motif-containing protein